MKILLKNLNASHQDLVLKEWTQRVHDALRSHVMAGSLSSGCSPRQHLLSPGASPTALKEASQLIVQRFYSDLELLWLGKNPAFDSLPDELHGLEVMGVRLTLPVLLEVVLAGESVFRDLLLARTLGNVRLSLVEAAECFEAVHRSFGKLLCACAKIQCGHCGMQLQQANEELANMVYPGERI